MTQGGRSAKMRRLRPTTAPRRSARLTIYESNGRRYLAEMLSDITGTEYEVQRVESVLALPVVRGHLQHWYRLCVDGRKRFNIAIDWVNTGERGYFYNPTDLENDLLLLCLAEGSGEADDSTLSVVGFADEDCRTEHWMTLELWARCAWRIAHSLSDNSASDIFRKTMDEHPAAAYAWAIDILTLAFHSLAHRNDDSCWHGLIIGESVKSRRAWERNRQKWLAKYGEAEEEILEDKSVEGDMDDDGQSTPDSTSSFAETLHQEEVEESELKGHKVSLQKETSSPTTSLTPTTDTKKVFDNQGQRSIGFALVLDWLNSFVDSNGGFRFARLAQAAKQAGDTSSDAADTKLPDSYANIDSDASTSVLNKALVSTRDSAESPDGPFSKFKHDRNLLSPDTEDSMAIEWAESAVGFPDVLDKSGAMTPISAIDAVKW